MKKVVLKLDLHEDKGRRKALKIVSGLPGVESVCMTSEDDRLAVMGDVDAILVVKKLKLICRVEVMSVGPASRPDEYVAWFLNT